MFPNLGPWEMTILTVVGLLFFAYRVPVVIGRMRGGGPWAGM